MELSEITKAKMQIEDEPEFFDHLHKIHANHKHNANSPNVFPIEIHLLLKKRSALFFFLENRQNK